MSTPQFSSLDAYRKYLARGDELSRQASKFTVAELRGYAETKGIAIGEPDCISCGKIGQHAAWCTPEYRKNGQTPPSGDEDAPPEVAPKRELFRTYTTRELLALEGEMAWRAKGFMVHPTHGMVAGEQKTLKSTIATFMDVAMAAGVPVFGQFDVTDACPVVSYVGEGGRVPHVARLRRVAEAMSVDLADIPLFTSYDVAAITSERFTRSLRSLRLVGTLPGSFVVALDGPSIEEQRPLPELDEGSLFERSVSTVFDVIEATRYDGYEELIINSVAALGSRVVAHLNSLAEAAARVDAPTEFRLEGERTPARVVSFDQTMAGRLEGVLANLESTEGVLELAGRLVGADMLRRTFALKASDDEVYRGDVDPDVVYRIEEYFNKDCRLTVRTTTTRHKITGKQAVKYTLLRFSGPLGE